MDHSLINANQLRLYGVTVQYNPVYDSCDSFGFHIGFNYQWIEKDNKERETKPTRGERCICDFVTTDRRDCSDRKILASSRGGKEVVQHRRIELDYHANTIVFGKNSVVQDYTVLTKHSSVRVGIQFDSSMVNYLFATT